VTQPPYDPPGIQVTLSQYPQGGWAATAIVEGKEIHSTMAPSPLAAARRLYRILFRKKYDPELLKQYADHMGVSASFLDAVHEVFNANELNKLQVKADLEERKHRRKDVAKKARDRAKRRKQEEYDRIQNNRVSEEEGPSGL
jgi:hypothetical protein